MKKARLLCTCGLAFALIAFFNSSLLAQQVDDKLLPTVIDYDKTSNTDEKKIIEEIFVGLQGVDVKFATVNQLDLFVVDDQQTVVYAANFSTVPSLLSIPLTGLTTGHYCVVVSTKTKTETALFQLN